MISELACYTYSMVAVPLYDTLGPDAIVYVINKGKLFSLAIKYILLLFLYIGGVALFS